MVLIVYVLFFYVLLSVVVVDCANMSSGDEKIEIDGKWFTLTYIKNYMPLKKKFFEHMRTEGDNGFLEKDKGLRSDYEKYLVNFYKQNEEKRVEYFKRVYSEDKFGNNVPHNLKFYYLAYLYDVDEEERIKYFKILRQKNRMSSTIIEYSDILPNLYKKFLTQNPISKDLFSVGFEYIDNNYNTKFVKCDNNTFKYEYVNNYRPNFYIDSELESYLNINKGSPVKIVVNRSSNGYYNVTVLCIKLMIINNYIKKYSNYNINDFKQYISSTMKDFKKSGIDDKFYSEFEFDFKWDDNESDEFKFNSGNKKSIKDDIFCGMKYKKYDLSSIEKLEASDIFKFTKNMEYVRFGKDTELINMSCFNNKELTIEFDGSSHVVLKNNMSSVDYSNIKFINISSVISSDMLMFTQNKPTNATEYYLFDEQDKKEFDKKTFYNYKYPLNIHKSVKRKLFEVNSAVEICIKTTQDNKNGIYDGIYIQENPNSDKVTFPVHVALYNMLYILTHNGTNCNDIKNIILGDNNNGLCRQTTTTTKNNYDKKNGCYGKSVDSKTTQHSDYLIVPGNIKIIFLNENLHNKIKHGKIHIFSFEKQHMFDVYIVRENTFDIKTIYNEKDANIDSKLYGVIGSRLSKTMYDIIDNNHNIIIGDISSFIPYKDHNYTTKIEDVKNVIQYEHELQNNKIILYSRFYLYWIKKETEIIPLKYYIITHTVANTFAEVWDRYGYRFSDNDEEAFTLFCQESLNVFMRKIGQNQYHNLIWCLALYIVVNLHPGYASGLLTSPKFLAIIGGSVGANYGLFPDLRAHSYNNWFRNNNQESLKHSIPNNSNEQKSKKRKVTKALFVKLLI